MATKQILLEFGGTSAEVNKRADGGVYVRIRNGGDNTYLELSELLEVISAAKKLRKA